jgi:hypothetical protein
LGSRERSLDLGSTERSLDLGNRVEKGHLRWGV